MGVDETSLDDRLRDLASDIEHDRGVVLSLLVISASGFEAQIDRLFFTTVQQVYVTWLYPFVPVLGTGPAGLPSEVPTR